MISHQHFFLGGVLVHDGVVGGGEGFIINQWGLVYWATGDLGVSKLGQSRLVKASRQKASLDFST